MEQYNEFLSFDNVLHEQDILGSIAFARANTKAGLLTKIEAGLLEVEKEWENGTFKIISSADENIHTVKERRLGDIIGNNIATDMRLWLRDELDELEGYLTSWLRIIAQRAEAEGRLRHARMLSYGFAFANDLERLREIRKRVNRSLIGCGAPAGNPFGIDREMMASELGFEGLLWDSVGAVADRDFVLETLQWESFLMQHISRWAEDLIISSSAEFGFVRLADAYSTGSSLMP
ncbi:hypothetical protein VPNG_09831 [Cytospora leucostoma]|uniref:Fumarate lyase N-terminal domain-containing protein n=1 Tax=Cytospora leucostoma TaxID=1230097 RepID=A0A423VM11_9PEZI|nr:hypothetical protein VPNG_09831 [Cytospora leucostoma]